jgi:hypothetical protein
MPYIKQERRERLDLLIDALIAGIWGSDSIGGEVNYIISRIVAGVLASCIPLRYKDIAEAVSAFECAKLEFYRRVASKLEDHAIQRNGDIQEYA